MGGRGAYSYSGSHSVPNTYPLSQYAAASLNRGASKGTSVDMAIGRFREQLMDQKVEFSAYIDDMGYIHSFGSTGKEGSTKVAPLDAIAKESGVSTIIHNHPHGGSDGRKWGGPFSPADLSYLASAHSNSNGKINRIVATAREGTYSATIKGSVSQSQIQSAASRAEKIVRGKKHQSEKAMWRAVNDAYTQEFGKIGIKITFTKQNKKTAKLTTQNIGNF